VKNPQAERNRCFYSQVARVGTSLTHISCVGVMLLQSDAAAVCGSDAAAKSDGARSMGHPNSHRPPSFFQVCHPPRTQASPVHPVEQCRSSAGDRAQRTRTGACTSEAAHIFEPTSTPQ